MCDEFGNFEIGVFAFLCGWNQKDLNSLFFSGENVGNLLFDLRKRKNSLEKVPWFMTKPWLQLCGFCTVGFEEEKDLTIMGVCVLDLSDYVCYYL